jgi:hypothetical protein
MNRRPPVEEPTPRDVFDDPIVQLAAICPLCALAALKPEAALAALSPILRTFNPATNPNAALLAFALGWPPAPRATQLHLAFAALLQARLHNRLSRWGAGPMP